ncbi:hypothetical protein BRC96_11165 [Halobacteriales archaeon QS_6_64_34]|nr:MAG: hypothetical protein BRC96_11165 [Halobacteriales archaeon QS_6_64_34]
MNAFSNNMTGILEKYSDRSLWYRAAEKYLLRKRYYKDGNQNPRGVNVMESDWDTLIVLDACRYDSFNKYKPDYWPSALPVRSRAANTSTFYLRNFDGDHSDTVVVTANPRTTQLRGGAFHDIIPVFEDDWDEDRGTVMPDVMAERTIEAHEMYPDKRILAHWIQPHYPFVGTSSFETHAFDDDAVFLKIQRGNVDPDEARHAYEECLQTTLPYVEDVVEAVSGKIVVSADHGNAFGESPPGWPLPVYGHPQGVLMNELVTVPWMEVVNGERRTITSGQRTRTEASTDVEERLQDLGYRT